MESETTPLEVENLQRLSVDALRHGFRTARKMTGLSQRAVARQADIAEGTVRGFEAGGRNPEIGKFMAMVKVVGGLAVVLRHAIEHRSDDVAA